MRLTCPNCQTQYEVDANAIPAMGRDVQCGNCQETWFQEPMRSETGGSEHEVAPDQEEDVVASETARHAEAVAEEREADASAAADETDHDEASPQASEVWNGAAPSQPDPQEMELAAQHAAHKHAALLAARQATIEAQTVSEQDAANAEPIDEDVDAANSPIFDESENEDTGDEFEAELQGMARDLQDRTALERADPTTVERYKDEIEESVAELAQKSPSSVENLNGSTGRTKDGPLDDGAGASAPVEPSVEPEESVARSEEDENTIDAIRAALSEGDHDATEDAALGDLEDTNTTFDQDDSDWDDDVGSVFEDASETELGSRIAGTANSAAETAAAVVEMPRPEVEESDDTGNLAERLKARVAEAAMEREAAALSDTEIDDDKIVVAGREVIETGKAARKPTGLPDADGLATSLRANRRGSLRAPATPTPTQSRFRSGFITAAAVFLLGLGIYLVAPQISARIPQLAPGLTSYANGIDGMRESLAGFFGQHNGTAPRQQ